jgi:NADPH:quinone reductase-like Zn-dependent oxidoreductase
MKAAMMVPGPQGGAWEVRDIQRPVVGPGQVLVRVRASSINRAEFRRLHGMKSGEARTGGGDAAGEVVAIGVDVTGIKEGDRIMARCAGGLELGRGGVGAGGVCRRA